MDNVFGAQSFSNSIIRSLKRKYILVNSTQAALDAVAYDGNICCIERLTDVKVILSVSILIQKFVIRNNLLKSILKIYL